MCKHMNNIPITMPCLFAFSNRSPGGTPLKQESLPCDVDDHAAVFARALKRKFSLCPVGSPDSEKENNTPVSIGPNVRLK